MELFDFKSSLPSHKVSAFAAFNVYRVDRGGPFRAANHVHSMFAKKYEAFRDIVKLFSKGGVQPPPIRGLGLAWRSREQPFPPSLSLCLTLSSLQPTYIRFLPFRGRASNGAALELEAAFGLEGSTF